MHSFTVGVFGSEKLSVPKKSNWKTGLFLDCTDRLKFAEFQVRYAPFLSCLDNLIVSEKSGSANFQKF